MWWRRGGVIRGLLQEEGLNDRERLRLRRAVRLFPRTAACMDVVSSLLASISVVVVGVAPAIPRFVAFGLGPWNGNQVRAPWLAGATVAP